MQMSAGRTVESPILGGPYGSNKARILANVMLGIASPFAAIENDPR